MTIITREIKLFVYPLIIQYEDVINNRIKILSMTKVEIHQLKKKIQSVNIFPI